jgi:Tol biopolymer transport system component
MAGCSRIDSIPPSPFNIINAPEELSLNLSDIRLIFSKNQNDETSAHITSLDRENKSTITLNNEGDDLDLSPDGTHVVYGLGETIDGELRNSIWYLDLVEGLEHRVILWPESIMDVSLANPSFFPDEEKLIFSITWYETDTVGLATINMDGSNLQNIGTPRGKLNEGPKISPDGEKILVLCSGTDTDSGQPGFMLCIMNSDGAERILLTKSGSYHGTYLFSPDSQSIIYSEAEWGGLIGLIDKPYYQIRRIDIDGKNLHTILDWHRAINVLALSDDGGEIIFMDRYDKGKTTKIYIVNKDGTNLRHLAYFDDFLADWYPGE